jgi:hypothetical protein
MNWQDDLKGLFTEKAKINRVKDFLNDERGDIQVDEFLINVVKPAFKKLGAELHKYGRDSSIESQDYFTAITVKFNNEEEFNFEVKVREDSDAPDTVFSVTTYDILPKRTDSIAEELTSYPQKDLGLISEEQIISDFIRGYQQQLLSK